MSILQMEKNRGMGELGVSSLPNVYIKILGI